MADGDICPPTLEWERLAQNGQLTTEIIRDFWKRTVPQLPAEKLGQVSYDEERCREVFLDPITQLLTADAPAQGQATSAGGMCGRVFKRGDPTYSCRDCQQDPTCVLCVECFQQSAHKNHRYQMCVSTGMGGYCDCGDAEAWKRDPYCVPHQPAASTASTADAQSASNVAARALTARAELVFSAAVQYVLSVVSAEGTLLNILPLELDLGREHYPLRSERYCTVIFNYGVSAYDKVADTLVTTLRLLPDEARNVANGVRSEGWAVLHVGDYNACDERLRALQGDQHRALRRAQVHVVHAHLVAHQRLAVRLMCHLRSMLETTPTLRPAFFSAMTQRPGGADEPSILDQLLIVDQRFWKQARHESHLLVIQGMLMDIESKKHFAEVFTERYEEQLLVSLPGAVEEQSGIQDLSVQIFTVPSVAHHLLAKKSALSVVLATLVAECKQHTHGGQLILRDISASAEAGARFERFLTCLMDARYLLTVVPERPMAAPLRCGIQPGIDTLLELLFCCEGMEPVVRAQTAHVLYDTPYQLQVSLAISLSPVVAQVLDWCASDRQLLIYAYKSVLRRLHARLPPERYFRQDEASLLGRTIYVSQFPVTEIPVSVELPLSRLFAGLYLHLADYDLRFDSEELICDRTVTPGGLLERPLRALIMDAQVRAGLWRRNGRSLDIICSWYSLSMQVAEMRDRDLQLAQICASLMDPDQFVALLLFRHGAQLYFTPAAEQAMEEGQERGLRAHIENNMSDTLLLMMHVFGERYHPGIGQVTKEQCLQNEVIQYLCVKPMTHSEIAKRLSEAYGGLLETVLQRVANFDTQEDFRGLRTYQLKPEYYHQYNCMWGHYSRRDRSMSEQFQQRRCQEASQAGQSTDLCLPPPLQPPFRRQLEPTRTIITCETTLRLLRAVLQRLSEGDQAGLSEQILQRCLFLIGMALNEEERDPANFSFSRPAQQSGLADILHNMVSAGRQSAHSDLLSWVVVKLDRLLGTTSNSSSLCTASTDAESEQACRRAAAAARRARILGQMQAQQRRFVSQNQTALQAAEAAMEADVQGESGATTGNLMRAGSSMDVSEGEDVPAPVCLGPRQSARGGYIAQLQTCILCQQCEQMSGAQSAWVTSAFVQSSTVLVRHRQREGAGAGAGEGELTSVPYVPSHLWALPHAAGCGHAMHAACWRQHFEIVAWARRAHPRVHHVTGFDVQKQEFLCPLCQRLSNAVVPILPPVVPASGGPAAPQPPQDNISLWIVALQKAVEAQDAVETEVAGAKYGSKDTALLVRIASAMAEGDAAEVRSLVTQGDAPPDVQRSTRDIASKFIKVIFTTLHGSQKPAPQPMRRAALLCCTYSLLAAEQLLRHQHRPLLPPDGGRANICLAQMALLCSGVLLNMPGGAATARVHVISLINAVLRPGNPSTRATSVAAAVTILDLDAVGLVLGLSCGLPALFADPTRPVPVPSGSLQDLHCVRLASLVRLTQILLTLDPSSLDSMDTGEPSAAEAADEPEEHERRTLLEMYVTVRLAAGLETAQPDATALRRHVIEEVAPFLRCCVLYFHYLTDVRAPEELQKPTPTQLQHPHLMRYLGLDTLCLREAADEAGVVGSVVTSWCKNPLLRPALSRPSVGKLVSSYQARLIELPANYEELLIKASTLRCDCGESEIAQSPALCLVCGAWLCSELTCGRDHLPPRRPQRGMDAHALSCGAGSAMLLLPRKCRVYLVHAADPACRRCTYPPPYVDKFGEIDQGFRRGNPLSLQPDLYNKLTTLWLSHGVSDAITRFMEESSSGMLFE